MMNAIEAVRDGRIAPDLAKALEELCGYRPDATNVRVLAHERLAPNVRRLRIEAGRTTMSVIARCSDAIMATRNRLLIERWLPAVRLPDSAPRLLASVTAHRGDQVWQLFEDLGDDFIDERTPDAAQVGAAIELVARLHTAFANHPLLAECRLWGTDFGIRWYSANVRDAIRALEYLREGAAGTDAAEAALCDRLLADLRRLRAEEADRARAIDAFGGAETLLHGDLWPKNIVVSRGGRRPVARLVDWDRVGVGPVAYDLSTFLSRLPATDRGWALEHYRDAVADRGWRLPAVARLEELFATAEVARLANRVIWPAIALAIGDADRDWAVAELSALAGWIEGVQPLLAHA